MMQRCKISLHQPGDPLSLTPDKLRQTKIPPYQKKRKKSIKGIMLMR